MRVSHVRLDAAEQRMHALLREYAGAGLARARHMLPCCTPRDDRAAEAERFQRLGARSFGGRIASACSARGRRAPDQPALPFDDPGETDTADTECPRRWVNRGSTSPGASCVCSRRCVTRRSSPPRRKANWRACRRCSGERVSPQSSSRNIATRSTRHCGAPGSRPGCRAARRPFATGAPRCGGRVQLGPRPCAARDRCRQRRAQPARPVSARHQPRAAVEPGQARAAGREGRSHRSAPARARPAPRRARHGGGVRARAARRACAEHPPGPGRHLRRRRPRRHAAGRWRSWHSGTPTRETFHRLASAGRQWPPPDRGERSVCELLDAVRRLASAAAHTARRHSCADRLPLAIVRPRQRVRLGLAPGIVLGFRVEARSAAGSPAASAVVVIHVALAPAALSRTRPSRLLAAVLPLAAATAVREGAASLAEALHAHHLYTARATAREAALRAAAAGDAGEAGGRAAGPLRPTSGAPCRTTTRRRVNTGGSCTPRGWPRLALRSAGRRAAVGGAHPRTGASMTRVVGVGGTLVSGATLPTLLGEAGTSQEPAIAARLRRWWRTVHARCGPASSTRALADVAASPLADLLGFTLRRPQPLSDTAWSAALDAHEFSAALRAHAVGRFAGCRVAGVGAAQPVHATHAGASSSTAPTSACSTRAVRSRAGTSSSTSRQPLTARRRLVSWSCSPPPRASAPRPAAGVGSPLASIVAASDAHGQRVCAALRGGVHQAIERLLAALADGGHARRAAPLEMLYEQALTAVYRILFLCFAEARGLVPSGTRCTGRPTRWNRCAPRPRAPDRRAASGRRFRPSRASRTTGARPAICV